MHALKADTHRKYGQSDAQLTLKAALLDPAFRVLAVMRLCQAADRLPDSWRWLAVLPARLLYRMVSQMAGIEIPWRTAIGPGLALTHGRGIVVNAGARIGSNVTLFHGVTLGQRDHIDAQGRRHSLYPVIEDEVWVGPHAIIVGGVTVGRGSRIAGGAYVFEDVPPYCVVLGNPGQIVRRDCTPDVDNRYDAEEMPVPQASHPATAADAGINAG
ncbi:serine O-acetyltransferase [Polaromonas sp. YR568]|uniref:serine O-acetyltransferase n=1 Tax=Polaromonas sp. YR568 TaxID=1855301 RepID=UPI00398BFC86